MLRCMAVVPRKSRQLHLWWSQISSLLLGRTEVEPTPLRVNKLPPRTPALRQVPPAPSYALRECWEKLRLTYFPDQPELELYSIRWSDRNQRSCLASCNLEKRRITVAKVLDHPSCHSYLEPLIYHEMCHAALGPIKKVNGRRVIHGREFKLLERRHPGIAELDRWIKLGGWFNAVKQHRRRKTRTLRLAH